MTKTATILSLTHSYCNHHVLEGANIRTATTRFCKPCIHAAACVKYGCKYAHPPGRKPECRFGYNCTVVGCPKLHSSQAWQQSHDHSTEFFRGTTSASTVHDRCYVAI